MVASRGAPVSPSSIPVEDDDLLVALQKNERSAGEFSARLNTAIAR
jgi:hypothetical protein